LLAHWNGTVWRQRPLPRGARHATLTDIAATSRHDVWIVGESEKGRLRTLHFNGTRWRVVPISGPNYAWFADIAAASPSDAWAVGDVMAHWDGHAWHTVRAPARTEYYGAAAISPTDAWTVDRIDQPVSGGTFGFKIEHWDGSNWTTSFEQGDRHQLVAIAASGPTDAWAVGNVSVNSPSDYELHPIAYHWAGGSWTGTVIPTRLDAGFSSITVVPGTTTYWAVGSTFHPVVGLGDYYRTRFAYYC
jgi:hypothetical protein